MVQVHHSCIYTQKTELTHYGDASTSVITVALFTGAKAAKLIKKDMLHLHSRVLAIKKNESWQENAKNKPDSGK